MADTLRDILLSDRQPLSPHTDSVALIYLASLATKPLASLESEAARELAAEAHSISLSIQDVSRQSHAAIINSAICHASLRRSIPALAAKVSDLRMSVPRLEETVFGFASSYGRSGSAPSKPADNPHLAGRRKSLLLLRNVERSVDMMELPTLLSSVLSAMPDNFALALDIYSHVQRIHLLYPTSPIVTSVAREADLLIRRMAADLLVTLRSPTLKLAASLRLVSCLRRILSHLDFALQEHSEAKERAIALIFLLCRMSTLVNTLDALGPLRNLADQERGYQETPESRHQWSGSQQTERFLKRYIELFREQSFGVLSMFRSIFLTDPDPITTPSPDHDGLRPMPPALATFPLCLADMLLSTLREYLPQVRDQGSRDSIMTQALYCAGSLGRLGGDFGVLLAMIATEQEWVEVVKKNRLLAGRLETIIGAAKDS